MTAAGIGYCAALTLATLFVIAAVGKLRHPHDTVDSFAALGVPAPGPVGRLLPIAELTTALGLSTVPWLGGLMALGMLAFFTTFLVQRLRAGVLAPCNCFVELGRGPLSWLAVVRNGLLMALAGLSMLASGPTRPSPGDVVVVVVVVPTLVAMGLIIVTGNRRTATTGVAVEARPRH